MRLSVLWAVAALVLSTADGYSFSKRDYDTHDFYALHLDSSVSPKDFADHLGLDWDGQLGELEDHHIFSCHKTQADVVEDAIQELKRRRRKRNHVYERSPLDGVLLNQKQKLKAPLQKRIIPSAPSRVNQGFDETRDEGGKKPNKFETMRNQLAKELEISDPIFPDQWHLFNSDDRVNDLNVTGLWQEGITGNGSVVCIVDDGLDKDSLDLKDNYFAPGSYDFNDKTADPIPRLADDRHGTRCAGEVAAGRNDACGVGVAYDAGIAGIRILSKPISDADEAAALNYAMQKNDIYSCSWGPPDDGRSMDAPGILIKRAMVNAIQKGRDGKGSIYVFAAGNGANNDDNCNFDGYTNSIYSITVGAIDKKNLHPYYSEKCSAQLVVTYSSGSGDAIHTTDVGEDTCSVTHGGTSAAGPLAAGVYALVLQIRPDLTWRDIQYLTIMTAVKFNQKSDWQETAMSKEFSHQFGYGKIDAYALVEAARDWERVNPQAWYHSPWMHVKHKIPQGDHGLVSHFEVTEQMLQDSNFKRVEHVTVTMNVHHSRRGDLSVELRSPSGVVSHLSVTRSRDDFNGGYKDWTFMSVAHWGETGVGKWTVVVKDTVNNEHHGRFQDWKLRLWGESIDADIQELLPMPTEHDDDDHNVMTGSATTASLKPTNTADEDHSHPSDHPGDHPNRPTKPSQGSATPTATSSFEAAVNATTSISGTPKPTASADDSFLPSPFPTFGLSKHAQAWVYGAGILIILFCAGVAVYLWYSARLKRKNSPRDDYEFAMLDDVDDLDDDLGDDSRGPSTDGAVGSKRRKGRRAGELYDAFAGESDEDMFSDDEDMGRYRDYDEKARTSEESEINEKQGLTGRSSDEASSSRT